MESQICQFYDGQNVFITGTTGFMGKVLLEKLLRSTNITTIYVLIRTKKGKDVQSRLEELLNNVLFEKLNHESPNFKNRVIAIDGDCAIAGLGLTMVDQQKLVSEVHVVFHGAATVRFNENLKLAYDNNVKGTHNVLTLCKRMKHLKSLVHLSTAFSNCHLDHIDEIFYEYPMDYQEVGSMLKELSLSEVEVLTPRIITQWPNSYVYTKALGEALIRDTAENLPIGIFRPGIVTSTCHEPIESWCDNFGGPAGVIAYAACGLVKTYPCENDTVADLVPVDASAAALVAIAWDVHNKNKESPADVAIYNYVSSVDNPITWQDFVEINNSQFLHYPLSNSVWAPKVVLMTKSPLYYLLKIVHFVPAILMDIVGLCCFKRPRMVSTMRKIDGMCNAYDFFVRKNFKFENKNVKALWKKMNEADRRLFPFDVSTINWLKYLRNYLKGLRIYLLKDPLESIPKAKIRARRFEVANKVLKSVLYLIGFNLISSLVAKAISVFLYGIKI